MVASAPAEAALQPRRPPPTGKKRVGDPIPRHHAVHSSVWRAIVLAAATSKHYNLGAKPYAYIDTTCATQVPHTTNLTCLANGAVVENGRLLADAPCNANNYTVPAAGQSANCKGAELIRRVRNGTLTSKELQVVIARFNDDLSWLDALDPVRMVYDHSSEKDACPAGITHCHRLLMNVGREAHVFLHHIYTNYEKLADRTVFFHGTRPSCGFFRVDNTMGNHLQSNVAAYDYMTSDLDVYAPLTVSFDRKLMRSSWRDGFEDKPLSAEVMATGQSVKPYPEHVHGWSEWLHNPFGPFMHKTYPEAQPQVEELHRKIMGRGLPETLYFAQGAQFSASRDAIRRVPREKWKYLLLLAQNKTNTQFAFWMELLWPTFLGAPMPDALYQAAHATRLKEKPSNAPTQVGGPPTSMISPTDEPIDPRAPRCTDEVQQLNQWLDRDDGSLSTGETTAFAATDPVAATVTLQMQGLDGVWKKSATSRWPEMARMMRLGAGSSARVAEPWPTVYLRFAKNGEHDGAGRLIGSECFDDLFKGIGSPQFHEEFAPQIRDPSPLAPKAKRIGWVHFPKAGSSILTALMRVANDTLPSEAVVRACGGCIAQDLCQHSVQGVDFMLRYRMREWAPGRFWLKKSGSVDDHDAPTEENGAGPFEGRLFAMFREPFSRAWSSYGHFGKNEFPQMSFAEYAKRIKGSATTVLTGQRSNGQDCLRSAFPCEELVPDAVQATQRLDAFAFVGIHEEWALSVCLLHVMHGGTCEPDVENANSRQHAGSAHSAPAPKKTEATTDEFDDMLYAAAKRRFHSDLAAHGVTQKRCEELRCWPTQTEAKPAVGAAKGK